MPERIENVIGADPTICRPCHGSGEVLARKGEDLVKQPCPWCEGTGRVEPPAGSEPDDES